MRKSVYPIVFLLACSAWAAAADPAHQRPAGDPERLGSVHFETSCVAEVQPRFARAMAMLHSFWYEEAGRQFRGVAEADPRCAIAWWGVAMSLWQPLWEPGGPNADALRSGVAAVEAARAAGAGTARERDFVAAIASFFENADSAAHQERVLAHERAMQRLHARYPGDTEASLFYALSLLGSAASSPPDKAYRRQREAGELLLPIFARQPEHPGVAHYIIHAYDYPSLAKGALDAARRYAAIAPDAPHAQHMPSHIFTRLGLWDDSIRSNRKVIEIARRYGVAGEELHAMDYLVFAYLQQGEDDEALAVAGEMPPPDETPSEYFKSLYAHAAIPARIAVERRDWVQAARLQPRIDLPGERYAWANAAIHFARALGAARTGDTVQARAEVEKLAALQDTLEQQEEPYWASQVEIQQRSAAAWVELAEGKSTSALELMRSAADFEDGTDKHPVTPGQIIPARELLGQMLLALDRPDDALTEFDAVLEKEPNRFGPLFGAAQAAKLAKREAIARERFERLVRVAPGSRRPEVREAMDFLARPASAARSETTGTGRP